jgi:hypothetical protein
MGHLITAPMSPRPTSLFRRLISLASQIFDTICRTSATSHPAADYRSIINNVFSAILKEGSRIEGETMLQSGRLNDEMSVDALFELMFSNSAGFEWQNGGLLRDDTRNDLGF